MTTLWPDIQANIKHIRDAISYSAGKSGRKPDEICLVVVTKKQFSEKIQELINLGMMDIGENYPEETVIKLKSLRQPPGLRWHMIGHLQSRKARIVADHFSTIHSIDRIEIATKLSQILGERNANPLNALIEVNISGEESKFGLPAWDKSQWDHIARFIAIIGNLQNLEIKGLMVMPPFFPLPEQARPYFEKTRLLSDYVSHVSGHTLCELSMGTSVDFQVAIEEGASIVRIGTAIMGPRIA
jgi:pyridoxal phosphate enzyme (YggS family)